MCFQFIGSQSSFLKGKKFWAHDVMERKKKNTRYFLVILSVSLKQMTSRCWKRKTRWSTWWFPVMWHHLHCTCLIILTAHFCERLSSSCMFNPSVTWKIKLNKKKQSEKQRQVLVFDVNVQMCCCWSQMKDIYTLKCENIAISDQTRSESEIFMLDFFPQKPH